VRGGTPRQFAGSGLTDAPEISTASNFAARPGGSLFALHRHDHGRGLARPRQANILRRAVITMALGLSICPIETPHGAPA